MIIDHSPSAIKPPAAETPAPPSRAGRACRICGASVLRGGSADGRGRPPVLCLACDHGKSPALLALGARLKALRKAAGIKTAADMGERAGLKRTLIHAIEAGCRAPSDATLAALASVLRTTPEQLLRGVSEELFHRAAEAEGGMPVSARGAVAAAG